MSLDDEKDFSQFNIDAYKADFVDNAETANNISSVLSAMVTHIDENSLFNKQAKETSRMQPNETQMDQTTAADSLEDLFE